MQILTRRRRGRKISRRRPRKVSRRQSLSRRRSKSRSGGKGQRGEEVQSMSFSDTNLTYPDRTKTTEGIDAHKALARELLANDEIKAYLQYVAEKLKEKAGGEEKFDEYILKALKAAAAGQHGGAPGDEDPPPGDHELSPRIVFETLRRIVLNFFRNLGRMEGINVALLVGLIFMMFMIAPVEARRMGRGNTARISTPAIDNMLNPYDPSRPGQIWSFWNALFSLFGIGPGAWGPDYHFMGPHVDRNHFYGPFFP
jgi:hypothetical protein